MAPFKFRFAKMSKSRSKESSSSSSMESDETINQTQRKTLGRSMTIGSTEVDVLDANNDYQNNFPNSPPPSYEHVLDEKRLRLSANKANSNDSENEGDRRGVDNIPMVDSRISDGIREDEGCLVMRGGKLTINGPEKLHKSSKELYRAVAKQCGITCKMSDHCRCFDCQSHYFDCEYEKDEQGKTDGGLGAGTPMFIAEIIHGTTCILL